MNTVFQFLAGLSDFVAQIFEYDVLPGISLFSFLFYNFALVVVVTGLIRRG